MNTDPLKQLHLWLPSFVNCLENFVSMFLRYVFFENRYKFVEWKKRWVKSKTLHSYKRNINHWLRINYLQNKLLKMATVLSVFRLNDFCLIFRYRWHPFTVLNRIKRNLICVQSRSTVGPIKYLSRFSLIRQINLF